MIELANSLVVATLTRRTPMRRVVAWVLAVVGSWAIPLGLVPIRTEVGLATVLLCSLILVIAVAAIGGLWPALLTAFVAFVADEFFFTPPYDSLSIRPTSDRVAVIVFVVVSWALGAVVGTLIDRLSGLANEQGALRRVATLVAESAPSELIFVTATEEAGHLLRVDAAVLYRFEPDGTVQVAAGWDRTGHLAPVQTSRTEVDMLVKSVGHPGAKSAVGSVVAVEGRDWGALVVASSKKLPGDTKTHLAAFADLVAVS